MAFQFWELKKKAQGKLQQKRIVSKKQIANNICM